MIHFDACLSNKNSLFAVEFSSNFSVQKTNQLAVVFLVNRFHKKFLIFSFEAFFHSVYIL